MNANNNLETCRGKLEQVILLLEAGTPSRQLALESLTALDAFRLGKLQKCNQCRDYVDDDYGMKLGENQANADKEKND